MRLTAFKKEQVGRVIRGPFEKHQGAYATEISAELAARLESELAARADSEGTSPTEVQIVCRSLFEAGLAGQRPGGGVPRGGRRPGPFGALPGTLAGGAGTGAAGSGGGAAGPHGHLRRHAQRKLRDDLIDRVALEDGTAKEVLGRALDQLEEGTRLVCRELRREVYFYEIVSEFLIGWIRRKAAARQMERVERANRRLRWLAAGLAAVVAIIVGLALVAFQSWRKAERQRQVLNAQFLEQSAVAGPDHQVGRGLLLALEAIDRAGPGRWRRFPLSWIPWGATDALETKEAAHAETVLRQVLGRSEGLVPGSPGRPVITSVLSGDRRWLAGTGRGGTLQLWELSRGGLDREPRVLAGYSKDLKLAAVSPDARWVAATPGDSEIVLWDTKAHQGTGSPATLKAARDSRIASLAFGGDGRWLVAAGETERPEFWRLGASPAGGPGRSLRCTGGLTTGRLNTGWQLGPKGRWLAVFCDDGGIVLWDLAVPVLDQGRRVAGPPGEIEVAAFSPSEDRLATGGSDGTICLWRVTGDPAVRCVPLATKRAGPAELVGALAFSPDGRWLAAGGGEGGELLWDTGTGQTWRFLAEEGGVGGLEWSPQGGWLLTHALSGNPHLQSVGSAGPKRFPLVESQGTRPWGTSAAFSRSDRWLALGGQDGTIRLQALTSDPKSRAPTLAGHDAPVDALAFTGDAAALVSRDESGNARIWEMEGNHPAAGPEPRILSAQSRVNAFQGRPGGGLIAAGWAGVTLFREPGAEGLSKPDLLDGKDEVLDMVLGPSGHRAVTLQTAGKAGQVRLWSLEHDRLLPLDAYASGAFGASPDGRWVAFVDEHGSVRLLDLEAGGRGEPRTLPIDLEEGTGPGLALGPGAAWLLTTHEDVPSLWDLEKAKVAPLDLRRHEKGLSDCGLQPRWPVVDHR